MYDVHEHYGDGPAVKSREEDQLEPGERQGQGRDVLENLSHDIFKLDGSDRTHFSSTVPG